jgi:regulatory protein
MPSRRAPHKPSPPLDAAGLRNLALGYVGRFATTEHKLQHYLRRKLRERGWSGEHPADAAGLAAEFARLGYVDDAAFGEARAASLLRRGYGPARVRLTLRVAGLQADWVAERTSLSPDEAMAAALVFARKRKIGPFAIDAPDPKGRARAYAALIRAGHSHEIARAIIAIDYGACPEGSD